MNVQRQIDPFAMFTNELINELVNIYRQRREVIQQLNHNALAQLLRAFRNPGPPIQQLLNPYAMLTNELITELVDRYQLERQRLIQ